MDKKTKLWLGVGIVGVGAYLLWKSKKAATPMAAATTTAKTPTQFVGAEGFASVGNNEKFNAVGNKVGDRQMNADGKFAGVGQRQVAADGGMLNGNSLDVKGGHAGVKGQGIFANKPFDKTPANLVSMSGDKVFANETGFFYPKTAKYGHNQGVFATSKAQLVGADGGFFNVHDGFGK